MTYTSWSIKNEDILLLRALSGVSHEVGFYIDVGANNPQEDSDTKTFYDYGWHGINIEPSPRWHALLAEQRPRDINIHAAASDKAGILTLYDHPEGGLGTMVESFADRHLDRLDIPKVSVEVQALTLTEICRRHAPPEIHFLKIDVEGHEVHVLRGMDFSRYRPWIICIEATEPLLTHVLTHHAWDHLITGSDYVFRMFDGLNRWYVAKEHPERMSAFDYPVDDYVHWTYLKRIRDLEHQLSQSVPAPL